MTTDERSRKGKTDSAEIVVAGMIFGLSCKDTTGLLRYLPSLTCKVSEDRIQGANLKNEENKHSSEVCHSKRFGGWDFV
jgi:hypothetical protein